MTVNSSQYKVAIVGGGRQGMALLEALVPPQNSHQYLQVIGVADVNPEAPGRLYAQRHGIFTTARYTELLNLEGLDLIFDAAGQPEVSQELERQRPPQVTVLTGERPYPWDDFWDLIAKGFAPPKTPEPLKVGLVGAGRGGSEVLRLITGDRQRQDRIQILGVADRNPQAPGMAMAQALGILTFLNYRELLQQNLDLIMELTGNPKVREELIRIKPATTQVIDHVEARLFYELLRLAEDQFRQKIESEIRLSTQRNRFQRIFDHLPDPVLVLNPDYTVEWVNLTFLNRFQTTEGQVRGQRCYQVLRHLDAPCHQRGLFCPLEEVLEKGTTVQVIHRCAGLDGEVSFDEISMAPLFPREGGTRKRVIEVIKDITPQKRLEEDLQKSEEKAQHLFKQANAGKIFLETILNGIQDNMVVIDADYRIIEVNRAYLEMAGLARSEVVGKFCYQISHHVDQPCSTPDHPCPLKDALRTGKPASGTHVHYDRQGQERYYHVVCHPLFDETGKATRVVELSQDITKEVMARSRMLHDDKMTSLGKLSASVVHEINNPLTGILTFIKLLQRTLAEGLASPQELQEFQRYLGLMESETTRVSKIVSNLLAFSRKTRPEFKLANINQIIEETLSLLDYQAGLQRVKIKRQYDPELLPVLADPAQLKQAFLNLFMNAQDAMPEGGELSIRTRNLGTKAVRVRISDTGMGIPKEHYSQIFEPFYTTKKGGGGAGLGLSVVYGIIKEHQGTIRVDSVVGQGTTFTIRLPARRPEEHADSPQKI
ncbi:MAG: PAS domain-containing protein [Desulfobacca sp.]|nr:PAS domain-containing protein [Desulfobacca sp.]